MVPATEAGNAMPRRSAMRSSANEAVKKKQMLLLGAGGLAALIIGSFVDLRRREQEQRWRRQAPGRRRLGRRDGQQEHGREGMARPVRGADDVDGHQHARARGARTARRPAGSPACPGTGARRTGGGGISRYRTGAFGLPERKRAVEGGARRRAPVAGHGAAGVPARRSDPTRSTGGPVRQATRRARRRTGTCRTGRAYKPPVLPAAAAARSAWSRSARAPAGPEAGAQGQHGLHRQRQLPAAQFDRGRQGHRRGRCQCRGPEPDRSPAVVLRITGPARSVYDNGRLLTTNIAGCLVNGAARGDLSSEKVYVKLQRMTCPQPGGRYAVSDVKGFIAFGGKTGVRGRVVSREGSLIGQAFLAGLAGGFGRGFSANTNTVAHRHQRQRQWPAPEARHRRHPRRRPRRRHRDLGRHGQQIPDRAGRAVPARDRDADRDRCRNRVSRGRVHQRMRRVR
jgi:conjugal transfer pilus assembly protein TraB